MAQALGDAMGDAVRHRLYEFKGTPRTCRARTRVSGFYGFIPRSIFCELPRACVCVCVCSGGEQGSIQALSLYAFMYRHNAAVC